MNLNCNFTITSTLHWWNLFQKLMGFFQDKNDPDMQFITYLFAKLGEREGREGGRGKGGDLN